MEDIRLSVLYPQPIQTTKATASKSASQSAISKADSFDTVLTKQLQNVKFSQHAQQRMQYRNIKLDEQQLNKLNEAVDKAQGKGVQDTLVLLGENAFIVNVPNRTVVTAVDQANLRENIFTNIDGAIII